MRWYGGAATAAVVGGLLLSGMVIAGEAPTQHQHDTNSPSGAMMEQCMGAAGHKAAGEMMDQMHGEGTHDRMHGMMDHMMSMMGMMGQMGGPMGRGGMMGSSR